MLLCSLEWRAKYGNPPASASAYPPRHGNGVNGHAGERIEQREDGLPNGSADIFEINVNPVRADLGKSLCKVRRAVVDDRIEVQFLRHLTAFVGASGDPDGLVSCPRNTRYFAGGQLAVFQGASEAPISESYGSSEQREKTAGVGGESGHAENAESGRYRRQRRIELAQSRTVESGVRPPSRLCQYDIPFDIPG